MGLNSFYNSGSDEELLKSLDGDSVHADQEELAKAMNKAGLVQKEVQVRGKNGQIFTRKQWVKAGEDIKQPKQAAGSIQFSNDDAEDISLKEFLEDANDSEINNACKEAGLSDGLILSSDSWSAEKIGKLRENSTLVSKKGSTFVYSNSGTKFVYHEENGSMAVYVPKDAKFHVNSKQTGATTQSVTRKFTPSSFGFRAGGQNVADMMNELHEAFGIKSFSNGQVGNGTAYLDNGESVGFRLDKDDKPYLMWQGQKFSVKELIDKWGGKKSQPPTSTTQDNKAQVSTGQKQLSKEDAKKKTQSLTSSVGKDDKARNDFMTRVKAQGVTWKENDHVGINWMRCCMAMNKHFENGGSLDDTKNTPSNESKNANIKSAKYSKKTGKVLEDFGKSKQQFDSLEQFVGSDMFKQTKKLYTRLEEIDHEAEQSLGSDDDIKEYKKEFNAIKKEFNSVRKLYEELCMKLPGGNWSKLPSGSPERRKAIDEYDTTKKLRDRAEKVLFPQYSEISYFGNGI